MFSQVRVKNSVDGGEVYTPWSNTLPMGRPPPWADTPGQTVTVADGTHPTGMHSCLCYVYTGSLKFSCVFLLLHIVESCAGRCNQHEDDTPADSCYCDDECWGWEDCWDDYETLCEDTMDNNAMTKSKFQFF